MARHQPEVGWVRRNSEAIGQSGILALAIMIGIGGDALAGARDYPLRNVGGWAVAASGDGTGCFLTKEYDGSGGTTLLLGLDLDGANRLTILNPNWSIAPRDRLALDFRLSNASFPRHAAVGIASGGKRGFVTSFGGKFPGHFATSRSLQVFRGDVPVARLNLEGSGAAVAELRTCVDSQRRGRDSGQRGSESSGSVPLDPFATPATRKGNR